MAHGNLGLQDVCQILGAPSSFPFSLGRRKKGVIPPPLLAIAS
jgi:hypothetical protein